MDETTATGFAEPEDEEVICLFAGTTFFKMPKVPPGTDITIVSFADFFQ